MANHVAYRLSLGRRFLLAVAVIAAAAAPPVSPSRAQSVAAPRPAAFEVASIRPGAIWKAGGEGQSRSDIEFSPDSLTMRNVDLSECVQWAYSVKFYQISGLNPVERYDILAKAEGPVPVSRLRAMLQDLLAKRFNLVLHRETKMLRVYELVAAKGGPKLPAAKTDAEVLALHGGESLPRVEDGNFIFHNTSMPEFAETLSDLRGIDHPVVDRTGVKGVFDITLKSAATAMLQPDGPSLFTLLQEQLGLKLVPGRAPVEVLVIDHAQKPSAN